MKTKGEPVYSISYMSLPLEYQDAGPWRSYELSTHGDTLQELLENATVSEIDQDGGELRSYGLLEGNKACEIAEKSIAVWFISGLPLNLI